MSDRVSPYTGRHICAGQAGRSTSKAAAPLLLASTAADAFRNSPHHRASDAGRDHPDRRIDIAETGTLLIAAPDARQLAVDDLPNRFVAGQAGFAEQITSGQV